MKRGVTQRVGFTLIELLISIAIIGLLLTILIPSIDRSLSRNDLANDAELFKSKVEETRLMASSTQQVDSVSGMPGQTAYYGVYVPGGTLASGAAFFTIVRVSAPTQRFPVCSFTTVAGQSTDPALSQQCVVQRIAFSRNVRIEHTAGQGRFLLFTIPTQQVQDGVYVTRWGVAASPSPWSFDLHYDSKRATINIEAYTAKVTINYSNN